MKTRCPPVADTRLDIDFRIVVDSDAEPVDWDSAFVDFLDELVERKFRGTGCTPRKDATPPIPE